MRLHSAVIGLRGRDTLEMRGLGYGGGRGGLQSLTDRKLLEAWLVSRESSKRRHDQKQDLAELAEMSLQNAVDAELERFEAHLTTPLHPPVSYVKASNVDHGLRTLASLVLRVASQDLDIDEPGVKWFRRAQTGETPEFESPPINGLADRETGVVWLSSKLSPLQVAATVAHEAAHLAGRGELDAQLYAAQYEMEET